MGILGVSKKDAWQSFADSMGAEVINDGVFKGGIKVRLAYKTWEIVMDTYTVSTGKSSTTYTRVRAIYVAGSEFDFKVFKTSVFTRMARALGRVYAPTGNAHFDETFSVRSLQTEMVKKVFENTKLKEMFFSLKRVYFMSKKSRGRKDTKNVEDECELHYYTGGVIKDNEQLTLIFGVMIFFLDAFEANGIAKSEKPKISYVR